MSDRPLLTVRDLSVRLRSGQPVVEDVSLTLAAGETLGIVGESGSGKTTTALALLGYARPGMEIVSGEVEVQGQRIALGDERAARRLRGRLVSHVPQDPSTNLNPSLRIGASIEDVVRAHRPDVVRSVAVIEALDRMHLPATRDFARRFPHQLSGGQQQRVLIASALVSEPPLVVLDEPTTGLDVVTQARILEEIMRLHLEREIAMIYVSHNLAVVSEVADKIVVMYGGHLVEEGPTEEVLARPRHPYTLGLVESVPDHRHPRRLRGMSGVAVGVEGRPKGCPFAPRCTQRVAECEERLPPFDEAEGRRVRCFEARCTPAPSAGTRRAERSVRPGDELLSVEQLHAVHRGHGRTVVAAAGVSFGIASGECVALVGESGSGKTTIARTIVGLHKPSAGRISLGGFPLAPSAHKRPREVRRRYQIVFQNPFESLNPRFRVVDEVARPARVLRGLSRSEAKSEVSRLLEQVRLPSRLESRYPSELSGGERQRVAIARALAARPELLICDEVTSALDVSVQAAVIDLLSDLREELSLSLLFITHDLGVVASIADRVLILDRGRLCEQGTVASVFSNPTDPRTIELLEAAPRLRTLDRPGPSHEPAAIAGRSTT